MSMEHCPSFIIAGVTSGVGKTTVTLAFINKLIDKYNLRVQSFKVGPDFIDPAYHSLVTKRPAKTLDIWMMGRKGVIDCFNHACKDAEIAVIEGVMGLYDGISGNNNYASTAHIAKVLNSNVILVVDASKASRSIAALAYGFIKFDRSIKIKGIIINNVASDKHENLIKEAFFSKIKVPIIGIIRRDSSLKIEERHLGLVTSREIKDKNINQFVLSIKSISDNINIDSLEIKTKKIHTLTSKDGKKSGKEIKIGIALDESFNFYYNENLEILRQMGADLFFFSPISDKEIPKGIDGIIIGGGFPEVLADKLELNESMKKSIRNFGIDENPIIAECGGLMYLTKTITGYNDDKQKKEMVGLIDAETIMTKKLTLNYTKASSKSDVFRNSTNIRGHEFHYSSLYNLPKDTEYVFILEKGIGIDKMHDGIISYNTIASYMHLHYVNKRIPKGILELCRNRKKR